MEAAGHRVDISVEPDCQDKHLSICVILNISLTSLCLSFPVGATVPIGLTLRGKLGYIHST